MDLGFPSHWMLRQASLQKAGCLKTRMYPHGSNLDCGSVDSASKCSQNFVSSIVPTCANMCHYVPAWANIAVCQLCRDRRPLWNSHDGVCINAMVVGVCARGKSSADAKYLLRKQQSQSRLLDPLIFHTIPRPCAVMACIQWVA